MIRAGCVALLIAVAGCGARPAAPNGEIPGVCEDQVYADPVVKDLVLKGAGSESFRAGHDAQLKDAKRGAAGRCAREKGLPVPG